MAITWLIKKDAAAPATLDSLGVTSCLLSLKANGVDSLAFTVTGDFVAAAAFPFASAVALIRRDTSASPTDRCVFKGTVESIPRQAVGGGTEDIQYVALGPAYALQLCDFAQEWHHADATGADVTSYDPTVVLGEDNAGTRLQSGGTIAHVADYAISRGVSLLKGTLAAGVWTPYDERTNITCWDAIVSMLRYTPDYVAWFDYDTQSEGVYVPTLNVTAPAAMASVTKAITALDSAAFTPRLDLRVPGILITYRWTGDWDGQTVKRRSTDSAGNISDPRRVSLVYELEGSHAAFITQDIEVENYPEDWTLAPGKAFLTKRIPWLAQMADTDWSVIAVTRDGTEAYPASLINGSVPEWTGKETEQETFTAEIIYEVKSAVAPYGVLDRCRRKLSFTSLSTDAVTKTYRRMTEWVSAEPVPPDLAANLYASWNRLHYDGQVSYSEQEPSVDARPGMVLLVSGGLTEWSTMSAIIQDAVIDIANGSTTLTVGTCGRLEADNLMAVYRAARGRRYAYLRLGRANPSSTDGNQIAGSSGMPNDRIADGVPACERQRFAVEAMNPTTEVSHRIDLAPELIAHAAPADESGRTLQPVELSVVTGASSTALTLQKAQVLASAPYGSPDTIPVGGGSVEVDQDGPIEDGTNGLTLKGHATMGLTNDLNLFAYIAASEVWRWVHTLPYGGLTTTVTDNQTLETVLTVTGAPTNGSSLGSSPKIWGWSGTAYQFFPVLVLDITSS